MQWIAPSAKDSATDTLEKSLWDAADQLRANSGLSPQQYSGPVLGLIFLAIRGSTVRKAARVFLAMENLKLRFLSETVSINFCP